jgi:hypothetical protein
MNKRLTLATVAGLLLSVTASAQTKQNPKETNTIEPLPRELEIQLALSALPPHLRDKATMYVLNPDKGCESCPRGHEWIPRLCCPNRGRCDEGVLALGRISRGH